MSRIELDDEGLDASWFPRPVYGTGRWYGAGGVGTSGGSAGNEGDLTVRRLWIPETRRLSGVAIQLGSASAGSTGAVVRMGIYKAESNGEPGNNLVLDAGTVDGTQPANSVLTWSLSTVLNPGLYWIGTVTQGGATTRPSLVRESNSPSFVGDEQTYGPTTTTPVSVYNDGAGQFFVETGVTGALPSSGITWNAGQSYLFPPAKMLWRFSA